MAKFGLFSQAVKKISISDLAVVCLFVYSGVFDMA